ncbi:hypothetical protein MtrunA17_Chr3g0082581 [Medicago truncatula]|uniref:Transmembrane protein n=1 Tax=Medicago truncatula TaxID=3880 RepID=A0A396IJ85_MEDTR|nr:hypothetical protein MtrunA17_Chr3g0082581 [Medicago truncatula]
MTNTKVLVTLLCVFFLKIWMPNHHLQTMNPIHNKLLSFILS